MHYTVLRQNVSLRRRPFVKSIFKITERVFLWSGCDMIKILVCAKVKGHPQRHS